jgi:hypothetical protein
MVRLVRSAGWNRKNVLDAIEQGQLVAIRVEQPRTRNKKWAILHPGIAFLDYLRSPETRMRYITILSEQDVASILNIKRSQVNRLVRSGKLQATWIEKPRTTNGSKNRIGTFRRPRFTAEAVRQYIVTSTGRDPKKRAVLTAEVLTAWFWRMMNVEPKVQGVEAVDEELRFLDEMCEPERSQRIDALLRLAEEARDRLASECEKK